jgi:hypothetical protein
MKDTQFPGVKCYDDGGRSVDRYTVVFTNQPERHPRTYMALAMNSEPFHSQGFGQQTTAMLGKHLGKRLDSTQLSKDCQQFIRQNL